MIYYIKFQIPLKQYLPNVLKLLFLIPSKTIVEYKIYKNRDF